jgi:hypothetical protein
MKTPKTPSPALAAPAELPEDLDRGMRATMAQARSVETLLAEDITRRQLEVSTLVGRMQAFGYINQFTGIARLKWLKEMKESKAYKGCKFQAANGEIVTLRTFEELCEHIGTSRSKVDEDLQNLAAFGESFLEASQSLGLGYRELRKLRALPPEEREVVIDEEKLRNDPETLLDKLQELVEHRKKEQAELEEAKKNLQAKDAVLQDSRRKLTETQTALERMRLIPPDEKELFLGEKSGATLKVLHERILAAMGSWTAALAQASAIVNAAEGEVHDAAREDATTLLSVLCSHMAQDLNEHGIQVDFRLYVYPAHLGQYGAALRGELQDKEESGDA